MADNDPELPDPDDRSIFAALNAAQFHASQAQDFLGKGKMLTEAGGNLNFSFAELAFRGADNHQVVAAAYVAAAGFGDDPDLHVQLGLDWLGREP